MHGQFAIMNQTTVDKKALSDVLVLICSKNIGQCLIENGLIFFRSVAL